MDGHAEHIAQAQARNLASVEGHMFKAVMRKLAGTVTVLAVTSEDGKSHGLTATAVCSVSVDPLSCISLISNATSSQSPECGWE